MKNQKLSIYLIKGEISNHADILKDIDTKETFPNGTLYYKKSSSNPPSWTNNFFNINIDGLKNSSASGLYITKIIYRGKNIYFGISFGHGWQMFKDGVIVERFWIKTALSIIKEEIKKIEKKNFTNGLKDVSEQLWKVWSVADFWFNVEQDIMKAVVGEPENEELFGKNVVGRNSISLSIKKDVDEIGDTLKSLYEAYLSNKYKERFDWFDNFSAVSDKWLITNLDSKLIQKVNTDTTEGVVYRLAIPEVIKWEDTKCFKYSNNHDALEYQDILFDDFKNSLDGNTINAISVDLLKKKKVLQIDTNDNVINEWSIYKCLYAEIDMGAEKYLLVSGKYYTIDSVYKSRIEEEFSVDTVFSLPDREITKHEHVYNTHVANTDNTFQCLDGGADKRNLIGKGRIEFADLVKSNKYLIHVKKYGASSVLSHLFSQGLVSSTLLLTNKDFRTKVNNKLITSHKSVVSHIAPNPADYTIVYAIGTTKAELKLPFFSLVNYRNTKQQLELYRYKVLLIKINQI